jgi:hypothetical protein
MHIFVQQGLITEEQYRRALAYQQEKRVSFQESLIRLSYLREDKVKLYCDRMLGVH